MVMLYVIRWIIFICIVLMVILWLIFMLIRSGLIMDAV